MSLYQDIYEEVRKTLSEEDARFLATRLSEMTQKERKRLFEVADAARGED